LRTVDPSEDGRQTAGSLYEVWAHMAGLLRCPVVRSPKGSLPDVPRPAPGTCRVSHPLGALQRDGEVVGHVSDQTRLWVLPSEL
jgi:hypothetical protein